MFNGKMKALTFSYDDGVTQDQRLIDLLNRYGMKGTFNLNSGLLGHAGELLREGVTVAHVKPRPQEIRAIYEGHEVAAHTLTHPQLVDLSDEEIIHQVEKDRLALSELIGYEVVGFAYPGSQPNYNEHIVQLIRENTGIRYARTTISSLDFLPPKKEELLQYHPTVYHHEQWEMLEKLTDEFIHAPADKPRLFYIWGHSYEFDIHHDWERFEAILKKLAWHDDIFDGTNRQVVLDLK